MENRVFIIALLGTLASFAAGCADDPDIKGVSLCNEGTSVCASAASANVCRNGAWVKEDCPPSYICISNTGRCELQNSIPNQPSSPEPSVSSNTGCIEGSVKCIDTNHIQKCQNGILVNYVCNINETCINGVCSLNPGPGPAGCTDGKKECVDEHHSRRCQEGQWVEESCENTERCDAGECKSNMKPEPMPDECAADARECVDEHHSRRCQEGQWVNETCADTEVCDAGECKPNKNPDPGPDECAGNARECVDEHHSKRCQGGKWVVESCENTEVCDAGECKPNKNPDPGPDECTGNARECVDKQHSRRCQGGKWVNETCAETEVCDAGECRTKTGPAPDECTDGKSECIDVDHERKCNKGKWVEKECSASESCTKTACEPFDIKPEEVLKTGTLADVGKKCSVEDFTDNCEDNQIIYCTSEGRIGTDDRCELYKEYSFIDMRCHVINGMAGCVYYDDDGNPDTCDAQSDTISCNKDGTVAYHSGCGKAEDGKLYTMGQYEFSEVCAMACKDGVGCVEIPENERCDVATHIETCENNSVVSCIHGRLKKTACGKQTCHSFAAHGVALCTDNTPCETLGSSNVCRYEMNASGDDYNAFDDSFMCAKAEDKKLYSYKLSSSFCSYDCVTDIGCVQPIKGEGADCSEITYEEKCRYGENFSAALACVNGTVEAIYCAKGKVCMNEVDSPTFVAGCYDDSSICTKGSADYTVCSGSVNYYSTVTYECKLMTDDKYHYTPNTDKMVSCKNGCNAAGTACK